MTKGLKIAEPPHRGRTERTAGLVPASEKFAHVAGSEKVQFNKRVTRSVADGYEMLAIMTRRRVPDLLSEGLQLLEERYGKS